MSPALELSDVRAGYGRLEVLHGIDLVVPHRSIVALLGPNGAGKSTAFSVLGGTVDRRGGTVRVDGVALDARSPAEMARRGIRLVPETGGVFAGLTVADNLDVVRPTEGELAGWAPTLDDLFDLLPALRDRLDQVAGTLSGGEQQMLALARGLFGAPRVLLVDELSTGLAPAIVTQLLDTLSELPDRGVAVLLSDQHADAVLDVAEICYVMRSGRVVHVGEPHELQPGGPARDLLGAA